MPEDADALRPPVQASDAVEMKESASVTLKRRKARRNCKNMIACGATLAVIAMIFLGIGAFSLCIAVEADHAAG